MFCVSLNPRQQLKIAAAVRDFSFQRVRFETDEVEEMPVHAFGTETIFADFTGD